MISDIFEKLGGAVVVSVLMSQKLKTVSAWRNRETIPARHRLEFIAVCKRHGIKVTLQELAKKA